MSESIQRADFADFPISQTVTVPATARLTFISGMLPDPVDPQAPGESPAVYGNTQVQTISVFNKLRTTLQLQGLDLGDVVQLRIFLVGADETGGRLDFAGMQAAYTQFFGTPEQPAKPARTALQVVALPLPGALVEVEAIAARTA